jgi:hypothetical protein
LGFGWGRPASSGGTKKTASAVAGTGVWGAARATSSKPKAVSRCPTPRRAREHPPCARAEPTTVCRRVVLPLLFFGGGSSAFSPRPPRAPLPAVESLTLGQRSGGAHRRSPRPAAPWLLALYQLRRPSFAALCLLPLPGRACAKRLFVGSRPSFRVFGCIWFFSRSTELLWEDEFRLAYVYVLLCSLCARDLGRRWRVSGVPFERKAVGKNRLEKFRHQKGRRWTTTNAARHRRAIVTRTHHHDVLSITIINIAWHRSLRRPNATANRFCSDARQQGRAEARG